MSLSGSRLTGTMHTDIKAALEAIFGPTVPAGATGTQTAGLDDAWDKLAQAIGNGSGPEIVSEITVHATVNPGTMAVTPTLIIDGAMLACSGDGTVHNGTGTVS